MIMYYFGKNDHPLHELYKTQAPQYTLNRSDYFDAYKGFKNAIELGKDSLTWIAYARASSEKIEGGWLTKN